MRHICAAIVGAGPVYRNALAAFLLVLASSSQSAHGQAGRSAADTVTAIADALGGRSRILAIRTLTIEGYGQLAYQNGGGNITGSPDAPQKWVDVNDYVRFVDLERRRTRVRQRQVNDFVFASARNMRGVVTIQGLDGDTAYNVNADGAATRAAAVAARARRMEMFAHPITIVRAALDPKIPVRQLPTDPGVSTSAAATPLLLEVEVSPGDTLMLAADRVTHEPLWVSWVGPDGNLGDVTYRAHFTGYQPVNGVRMPTGIATTIDFRDIVQSKLYVDRHAVDAPIEDLTAPAAVRGAPAPVPQPPAIEATALGKGIWFLRGAGNSTLFEFDDHLTLFEVYGSEANGKAVIDKARSLVPGKPLTEVIVSHHHFDHTGGLRVAVAEGLTVITARGNEGIMGEVTRRPAKQFPDALGRNPKALRLRTVDDHLKLRDGSMDSDIYRIVANSHMADGLMVYVPRDRLLVQGDLFDVNWEIYWWGSSYLDNVMYRKLQVDRDVPVHGRILPFAEVQQHIATQIKNAQGLCAAAAAANLTLRGCPVKTTVDR